MALSDLTILIRGAGDLASGVAWRLYQCGFKILMTEIERPSAVRRTVSFCESVYERTARVEGVEAICISRAEEAPHAWEQGKIPVLIDPACESRHLIKPHVLVDAILAKRNLGTSMHDAPLVIALGPGFEAGKDCHFIVETNRGHNLGRLLTSGAAESNTGVPGPVQGIGEDRLLRAPVDGLWKSKGEIGDLVKKGDVIGSVAGLPVKALIDGVIRGLIHTEVPVNKGLKIGDIDPRNQREYCYTISDKALAIAGGVLEGILRVFPCPHTDRDS